MVPLCRPLKVVNTLPHHSDSCYAPLDCNTQNGGFDTPRICTVVFCGIYVVNNVDVGQHYGVYHGVIWYCGHSGYISVALFSLEHDEMLQYPWMRALCSVKVKFSPFQKCPKIGVFCSFC